MGTRGGAIGLSTIQRILCELVKTELAATTDKIAPDVSQEIVVQYVVGATMAVITWWLESGARLPAVRVDAMLRSLAVNGVAGLDRT